MKAIKFTHILYPIERCQTDCDWTGNRGPKFSDPHARYPTKFSQVLPHLFFFQNHLIAIDSLQQ